MDRGTWWDTVLLVAEELDMTEQLTLSTMYLGFPGGSLVKNPPADAED